MSRKWDDIEHAALIECATSGRSYTSAAISLHRTRNSIAGRAARHKIVFAGAPVLGATAPCPVGKRAGSQWDTDLFEPYAERKLRLTRERTNVPTS